MVLAPGKIGHLMLLKHISNLSHLVRTAVILGLTHISVTHTTTYRTGKTPQMASMHFYSIFGSNLCLNAQIPPFITYFLFYVCAYILFVLIPAESYYAAAAI